MNRTLFFARKVTLSHYFRLTLYKTNFPSNRIFPTVVKLLARMMLNLPFSLSLSFPSLPLSAEAEIQSRNHAPLCAFMHERVLQDEARYNKFV